MCKPQKKVLRGWIWLFLHEIVHTVRRGIAWCFRKQCSACIVGIIGLSSSRANNHRPIITSPCNLEILYVFKNIEATMAEELCWCCVVPESALPTVLPTRSSSEALCARHRLTTMWPVLHCLWRQWSWTVSYNSPVPVHHCPSLSPSIILSRLCHHSICTVSFMGLVSPCVTCRNLLNGSSAHRKKIKKIEK